MYGFDQLLNKIRAIYMYLFMWNSYYLYIINDVYILPFHVRREEIICSFKI